MAKKSKQSIRFRLWIYAGEEKLLGKGRVELLERINATGSISSAAKKMKMSYRQAWQMVEEMNDRSKSPLVEKQLGGKKGGGAKLTESGTKAIAKFHELEKKLSQVLKKETKTLNF